MRLNATSKTLVITFLLFAIYFSAYCAFAEVNSGSSDPEGAIAKTNESKFETKQDSKVISFGHNLSATGHLLRSGDCTLGLYAFACGLSDRITLGASPWLLQSYNMYNLISRFRVGPVRADSKNTVQLGYFKTFPTGRTYSYEMEAAWGIYVHSSQLNERAWVHYNFQTMYFLEDIHPFSLRRPWPDKTPVQINTSALTEYQLHENWFINFELGLLGTTQRYFQIHLGSSLEYRGSWWLAHVGFSQTGSPSSYGRPFTRSDWQQGLRGDPNGLNRNIGGSIKNDYSLHPEFVWQGFF